MQPPTRFIDLDKNREIDEDKLEEEYPDADDGGSGGGVEFEEEENERIPSNRRTQENSTSEKDLGNQAFADGRHEEACAHWKRSLRTCRYVLEKNVYEAEARQRKEIENMATALNLNLALGHIKLRKFHDAIGYCEEVLQKDQGNVKAHFRKADAEYRLSEFADALNTLGRLLEIEPRNGAALHLKQLCVGAHHAASSKACRMYKEMFAHIETDPRVKKTSSIFGKFVERLMELLQFITSWFQALCHSCLKRKAS